MTIVDQQGEDVQAFLDKLPLVQALWWFIENTNEDTPYRTELFFHLRERYRSEA